MTAPLASRAIHFLDANDAGPVRVPDQLHGFGGLHGGLALARLTAAMAVHAPGRRLRSTTGLFHQPVRDGFTIAIDVLRSGSRATTVAASAVGRTGEVLLSATAVFGAPSDLDPVVPGPVPPPDAAHPEEWDVFEIPVEFVPIAAATEIRPVGLHRPYAGGDSAELTAWVRMIDDGTPPDALRLIFLLDALAPSYAAVLGEPRTAPTVELSVRPQPDEPRSPWLLVQARTAAARAGWMDEDINAWDLDGNHVASAHQLRIVR